MTVLWDLHFISIQNSFGTRANVTMELLTDVFPQTNYIKKWRLGSKVAGFKSFELFFVAIYRKSKIYVIKRKTLQQLKQNIRNEINEIPRFFKFLNM